MIMVINYVTPPKEKAEDFKKAFMSGNRMQGVPGLLGFEFWKEPENHRYLVVTRWQSEQDFHQWRQSESFRRAHRDTSSSEGGTSELGIYQVLRCEPNPWASA